jgi:hypothetical protein
MYKNQGAKKKPIYKATSKHMDGIRMLMRTLFLVGPSSWTLLLSLNTPTEKIK